ncbi:hypothetical protein MGG_16662 [Pyricularia oryzae 70-15]|uniref:Uncharacterized protein n=1 Tax=Pyricularia oryzae (strain 70-15 / ATCC MYA-4617 / FGSC 8958) TaxID=242507 RepID=G4N2I9_PYRO7|nr:uncharacterized protein MGG_16662 [Pyricularia oryzae 70-15]EHA51698.1 hypothetical protein MGG_16662 [Pyricularia oryzae 70-15]
MWSPTLLQALMIGVTIGREFARSKPGTLSKTPIVTPSLLNVLAMGTVKTSLTIILTLTLIKSVKKSLSSNITSLCPATRRRILHGRKGSRDKSRGWVAIWSD